MGRIFHIYRNRDLLLRQGSFVVSRLVVESDRFKRVFTVGFHVDELAKHAVCEKRLGCRRCSQRSTSRDWSD